MKTPVGYSVYLRNMERKGQNKGLNCAAPEVTTEERGNFCKRGKPLHQLYLICLLQKCVVFTVVLKCAVLVSEACALGRLSQCFIVPMTAVSISTAPVPSIEQCEIIA